MDHSFVPVRYSFSPIPGNTNEIADYLSRNAGISTAESILQTDFHFSASHEFTPNYEKDPHYSKIISSLAQYPSYTLC